jgi:chromosome segregation ATPase
VLGGQPRVLSAPLRLGGRDDGVALHPGDGLPGHVVERGHADGPQLAALQVALDADELAVHGRGAAADGLPQRVRVQEAAQLRSVEQRFREIKIEKIEELNKVLPAVQSAAQQIDAQKAQVSALAQGQEKLQRQLTDVASGVQEMKPQILALTALAPAPDLTPKLQARLDNLEQTVTGLRQSQAMIADQQKRITVSLEQIRKEKPLSPGGAVDLGKLEERLRALEQSH